MHCLRKRGCRSQCVLYVCSSQGNGWKKKKNRYKHKMGCYEIRKSNDTIVTRPRGLYKLSLKNLDSMSSHLVKTNPAGWHRSIQNCNIKELHTGPIRLCPSMKNGVGGWGGEGAGLRRQVFPQQHHGKHNCISIFLSLILIAFLKVKAYSLKRKEAEWSGFHKIDAKA